MKRELLTQPSTLGSSFESFLEEEGILNEVQSGAIKRVLADEFGREMLKQKMTRNFLAKELRTSRSQVARLLDPANTAVSLETISRAADVLKMNLIFRFEPKRPARKTAKKAS